MKAWLTAAALLLASPAFAQDNPLLPSETWNDLRESVVGLNEEPPIDATALDLDAPFRANDAAIVPIRLTQAPDAAPLTDLTLVIDENPAPVAAEYSFGDALMPLDFEVRVRVDAYSDVRAIGTRADGGKIMAGRFVKASGGCSAPATKDPAVRAVTFVALLTREMSCFMRRDAPVEELAAPGSCGVAPARSEMPGR